MSIRNSDMEVLMSPLRESVDTTFDHTGYFLLIVCKKNEYGLNRETRRFMNIQFSVDKFHESNHTSCGKTFNSSEYVSLRDKNSQACEQVNAKLRTIATTCTFMNPDMFMRSISLFLSYQNTKNSE